MAPVLWTSCSLTLITIFQSTPVWPQRCAGFLQNASGLWNSIPPHPGPAATHMSCDHMDRHPKGSAITRATAQRGPELGQLCVEGAGPEWGPRGPVSPIETLEPVAGLEGSTCRRLEGSEPGGGGARPCRITPGPPSAAHPGWASSLEHGPWA